MVRIKIEDLKVTDKDLKMVNEAENSPIVFDEDCPKPTKKMEQAFKRAASIRNQKKTASA